MSGLWDFWREMNETVHWRRERDAQQRAWEQGRARDEEWHTGVWRTARGVEFRVRWDPLLQRFFIGDKTGTGSWWYETRDRAARLVRALERSGWRPDEGPETARVRERLLSEFLGL